MASPCRRACPRARTSGSAPGSGALPLQSVRPGRAAWSGWWGPIGRDGGGRMDAPMTDAPMTDAHGDTEASSGRRWGDRRAGDHPVGRAPPSRAPPSRAPGSDPGPPGLAGWCHGADGCRDAGGSTAGGSTDGGRDRERAGHGCRAGRRLRRGRPGGNDGGGCDRGHPVPADMRPPGTGGASRWGPSRWGPSSGAGLRRRIGARMTSPPGVWRRHDP